MEIENRLTLKVKEASELLGLPTRTVYQLCHRADFPSFNRGKTLLISRPGLEKWVMAQAEKGMEKRKNSGPRRAGVTILERDAGGGTRV